jgi:hypothetical protein
MWLRTSSSNPHKGWLLHIILSYQCISLESQYCKPAERGDTGILPLPHSEKKSLGGGPGVPKKNYWTTPTIRSWDNLLATDEWPWVAFLKAKTSAGQGWAVDVCQVIDETYPRDDRFSMERDALHLPTSLTFQYKERVDSFICQIEHVKMRLHSTVESGPESYL